MTGLVIAVYHLGAGVTMALARTTTTAPPSTTMAKARKNTPFEFETLSEKEASERRSARGTRRSKYSPIGDQFRDLDKGTVLAFTASKNEVQGVRNYMRRNFEGEHRVNSRRTEGDMYEVHISRAS